MFLAKIFFYIFLFVTPHIPPNINSCILRRAEQIVRHAAEGSQRTGVPVEIFLTVGFFESHWGCDPRSGGCWGAPRDNQHRNIAGTPGQAASSLASGYRACHTWRGAISRFRCGLCRCTRLGAGYGSDHVSRKLNQLYREIRNSYPFLTFSAEVL